MRRRKPNKAKTKKNLSKKKLRQRFSRQRHIENEQRPVIIKKLKDLSKDRYIEIIILSLDYAAKPYEYASVKKIQNELVAGIKNKRKRDALNPFLKEEGASASGLVNKVTKLSNKRLLWAREFKLLVYAFKVINGKVANYFMSHPLSKYSLFYTFGIASFAIYTFRLLSNLAIILYTLNTNDKKDWSSLLKDQWIRRANAILNDILWVGINSLDFFVFAGKIALPFAPIILPVVSFFGYLLDLLNELNALKRTRRNYEKVKEAFKNNKSMFALHLEEALEKNEKKDINKHRVSIAIAASLSLLNLFSLAVVLFITLAVVSNPHTLALAFSLVTVCALATVFCSKIKSRYKKDYNFKKAVDKTIGIQPNEQKSRLKYLGWGKQLFRLYRADFFERLRNKKEKFCIFNHTQWRRQNQDSEDNNMQYS